MPRPRAREKFKGFAHRLPPAGNFRFAAPCHQLSVTLDQLIRKAEFGINNPLLPGRVRWLHALPSVAAIAQLKRISY